MEITLPKELYKVYRILKERVDYGEYNISLRKLGHILNVSRYKVMEYLTQLYYKGLIKYILSGYTVKIVEIADAKVVYNGNDIVVLDVEKLPREEESSVLLLPIYVYNMYLAFLSRVERVMPYEKVLYLSKIYNKVFEYKLAEIENCYLKLKDLQVIHEGRAFVACKVRDIIKIKLV